MNPFSIANTIITTLEKGPMSKADLLTHVCKRKDVTIQGVYKEIRKLLSNGTILLHKKALSLNLLYISKQYDHWSSVLNNYEGGLSLKNHFLDLKEGESLTYRFKTLNDLDAYWVHATIILDKHMQVVAPSYSVIPHDWFLYGRKETDTFWTKSQKNKMRLIVTHPTLLDKEVARERRANGYNMMMGENPLKQDESTYYTLIDGYVLKVKLDNQKLRGFLNTYNKMKDIDPEELAKLIYGPGTAVMKITKDRKAFERLAAKCKKYFE